MSTLVDYDNQTSFRAALEMWPCRHCGNHGVEFHGPGAEPHFAALICLNADCGRFVAWLPWPTKTAQTRRRTRLPVRLDENRCHICGRTHAQTRAANTTLQAHHLIDRQALVDTGVDPDDLKHLAWVCGTPCHTIVTALRAALGSYVIELPR